MRWLRKGLGLANTNGLGLVMCFVWLIVCQFLCLIVFVSKRRLRKGLGLGLANTYGLGLGLEECSMWLLMFMHMQMCD